MVIFAVNVIDVEAYSCHEVRTAFQLRQVGPLHRVPETPGTGEPVDLACIVECNMAKAHCKHNAVVITAPQIQDAGFVCATIAMSANNSRTC